MQFAAPIVLHMLLRATCLAGALLLLAARMASCFLFCVLSLSLSCLLIGECFRASSSACALELLCMCSRAACSVLSCYVLCITVNGRSLFRSVSLQHPFSLDLEKKPCQFNVMSHVPKHVHTGTSESFLHTNLRGSGCRVKSASTSLPSSAPGLSLCRGVVPRSGRSRASTELEGATGRGATGGGGGCQGLARIALRSYELLYSPDGLHAGKKNISCGYVYCHSICIYVHVCTYILAGFLAGWLV